MEEGTLTFHTSAKAKFVMRALATAIGASAYFCMAYCVEKTTIAHNECLSRDYVVFKKES